MNIPRCLCPAGLAGLSAAVLSLLPLPMRAETVKDREGAVRGDRAKMETDARWIYNDVAKGFAEARATGKPLLVTLRCVPCVACQGIDAGILNSSDLQPLLDQFVCVRVINANALDLSLFQFDYDLSFSTLIFNADGTIYGRYGSWRHQKDAADATTAGYRAALEAALDIHRGYPANKVSLNAKQGAPVIFRTPIDMPSLAGKYERELNWGGKVVQSCVHCHQIGDALRASFRDAQKPLPAELIYPMPAPETVGLSLDAEKPARVVAVAAKSAAEAAGLAAGDELVMLNGAPPISIADVAWALHRAPEQGELPIGRKRGDKVESIALKLAGGWRQKTDISTRVGTWQMRAMALGGLVLRSLSDEERTQRRLLPDALGLRVHGLGDYGPHGAAKSAGFRKEDILISVEGIVGPLTEGELIGRLLTAHPTKGSVPAVVLRGDEKVKLSLPMP